MNMYYIFTSSTLYSIGLMDDKCPVQNRINSQQMNACELVYVG